jgi:hypothetical protein
MPQHVLEALDNGYQRCTLCNRRWKIEPQSECPGVPVYQWEPWPEGLYTQTQLGEKGYKPGPVAGVIPRAKSPDGWLKLYRLDNAIPKRQPTEAQKAALAKAQEGRRRSPALLEVQAAPVGQARAGARDMRSLPGRERGSAQEAGGGPACL